MAATTTRKPRKPKPKTGTRAGQPSPIDRVIGYDPQTGDPITVAERIVRSIRAGNYFEPSAIAAGVTKETAYEWLRVAGKVRLTARGRPLDTLTPQPTHHQRRCVEFSDAVDEAQGLWEVGANTQLEALSRGGLTVETVTEKHDPAGKLLERTVKTETLAPNAQVIEWRLTRKNRLRYGDKLDIDAHLDGQVQLTVEERASDLMTDLAAYLAGVDDGQQMAEELAP